jgi:hypothetical protein
MNACFLENGVYAAVQVVQAPGQSIEKRIGANSNGPCDAAHEFPVSAQC